MNASEKRHVRVAIVGSGFAGIGTAIRLKQTGRDDFVLFERGSEVGGVWRDNTYPGCACDVRSHLYSLSFAPNPRWSRSYSPQREILEYLRGVAERFGILPHVRFGHEVKGASWDDQKGIWRIETSRGEFTADVLVAANGALSDAKVPDIAGLASFEGEAFHSARWNHDYDLRGKRVAVVGTGASAIQFVPHVAPVVDKLLLFQRTPPWILPRRDKAISEGAKRLYRALPVAQKVVRGGIYALREALHLSFREGKMLEWGEQMARKHLAAQVRDPALRAKLTPNYRMGCKRILLSDDYLPALTRPNVDVITSGIREVRARSIVGSDGVEHPVDAIVFGTGFQITEMPIASLVRGRDGKTLAEAWRGSPEAHLGTMVKGFPNLFLMQGPNTGLGHTSVIVMIEAQIEYLLKVMGHMERRDAVAVEPKSAAQAAFVRDVDAQMKSTVWAIGGCASWYMDATGRNSTLWPGFTFSFRKHLARFVPSEYEIRTADQRRSIAGGGIPITAG